MEHAHPRKSKYRLKVHRGSSGLGLFTEDSIKKGAFVIEYFGQLLSDAEADRRGGRYLFEVNSKWTIDGSPRENLARYINHACTPNCETDVVGHRVFIYAKRNIKPGEELSYDYGKGYFEDIITPKRCRCARCVKKKNTKRKRK